MKARKTSLMGGILNERGATFSGRQRGARNDDGGTDLPYGPSISQPPMPPSGAAGPLGVSPSELQKRRHLPEAGPGLGDTGEGGAVVHTRDEGA